MDDQPDPTTAWASDVVSGRIVAGELVRHAAERHLRDLRDGPARGLHWVPERAAHAIGFYPALFTITAGAKAGKPFDLLPWHTFAVGSLFGWHRADGLRRFRKAWFETGKGQAKSPMMAGIGLYVMGFSGVARAECYCVAGDKDQARIVFMDAVAMCRAQIPGEEEGDTLETRGTVLIRGTGDLAWKIEHPDTGSTMQPFATTGALSGPRPAVVLADEVHEFRTAVPIEMWGASIAKMPGNPLMCLGTNTPAADQPVATEYSAYYQEVARGTFPDDSSLALVFRVDEDDDPFEDEACWPKALPALGITYPVQNVREEVQTARRLASKALTVKRLYFGIPVGTADFWVDLDAWDACLGEVDEAALQGCPCWLGMDLSQRHDLTALAAVWRLPDGRLAGRVWYWKPRDGLAEAVAKDRAPYDAWAEAGILHAVPGRTIDKAFVVAQVQRICAAHDVQALAFDAAHFEDFRTEAARARFETWEYMGPGKPRGSGLKMVRHAQGAAGLHSERQLWMPRSVQSFEDRVLKRSILVERTGLTTWCASNAALVADGQGNRWFDKRRSRGRIDGLVALCMATGAADDAPQAAASIFDREDLWDS